ncbi:hypothetical protein TL16_g12831 [Triparma laevis f. inornata]|uniref:BEACH domain-containing protein n=1 Tax=Triparma laevis f. inornata TaxID=1714386 RepID=A0A9W7BMV0_9STRA|nr:hypothetical protein TL16_g12831 [Triparma laevis f. inornata]
MLLSSTTVANSSPHIYPTLLIDSTNNISVHPPPPCDTLHTLLRTPYLATPPLHLTFAPQSYRDLKCRFLILQMLKVWSHVLTHRSTTQTQTQTSTEITCINPHSLFLLPSGWLYSLPSTTPLPPPPPSSNLTITEQWIRGLMSNYEYLLKVNHAAGRTENNPTCHPVFPWVTTFKHQISSSSPATHYNSAWRDLSKSKYRLIKGEQQLDLQYSSTGHHVTENLGDITYWIYNARRADLETLRRVVRGDFVKEHYPSCFERMFSFSPDECVPEFYWDEGILETKHEGLLPSITVPEWCESGAEFIKYHRGLLESDYVSWRLSLWIDLNFGVSLSGKDAVRAKNVPLVLTNAGSGGSGSGKGFYQLFTSQHPRRKIGISGKELDWEGGARRESTGSVDSDTFTFRKALRGEKESSERGTEGGSLLNFQAESPGVKDRKGLSPSPIVLKKVEMGGFLIILPTLIKTFKNVNDIKPTNLNQWTNLVKVVCERLGAAGSTAIVLPEIVNVFDTLISLNHEMAPKMLQSNLLLELYHLTEGGAYIKSVVGFLMGVIGSRSKGKEIKAAVALTLATLCNSMYLGPALGGRYVVPALVSICGNFRLHSSPPPPPDVSHMHVAHALSTILPLIPEEGIALAVCTPLFDEKLPKVVQEVQEDGNEENVSALIEVIYVLHACLAILGEEGVSFLYLGGKLPVHQLVLVLMTALHDSGPALWALTEAGSLLSSVCMCVRRQHVIETILPALDAFFGHLHDCHVEKLSESSQKISILELEEKGVTTVLERAQKKDAIARAVLELPGMKIGKDLYDTCKHVVGSEVMVNKCASANMMVKWFDSGVRGFGWIRRRVRILGKPEEEMSTSTNHRRSSAALITEDDMGRRVSFVRALSNEDDMGLIDDEEEEDSDSDGGEDEKVKEEEAKIVERRRSSPTIDIVKDKSADPAATSNASGVHTPSSTSAFTPPFATSSLKIKNLKVEEEEEEAEAEKVWVSAQERRRVDRTWLMGSTTLIGAAAAEPWKKIGSPWSTHMVLLSELRGKGEGGKQVSAIRALATNSNEGLLATGSRNGEVLIWDLASHPPTVKSRHSGHRIARAGDYFRPEVHELYDEGGLKTGEILQLELTDQGSNGIVCDGNLHVFDVETNQSLAVMKRNSSKFGGGGFGHGGAHGGGGWFGGLDESGDVALGAFGLSGLMDGRGGGGSYDVGSTENDPIVAFRCLPVGGGGGGTNFCSPGEESKRGQQIVCISSDRLHHVDLRETSKLVNSEMGILTLPGNCILKNYCEACAGVGTFVPRKLCKRHLHPYALVLGGSWLLGSWWGGGGRGEVVREGEGGLGGSMLEEEEEGHKGGVEFGVNTCLAVQCEGGGAAGGGDWVCVGRSDGICVCVERRTGRILHTWKAHEESVVQIYAVNLNQVVTVGKDKRAVLWDLRGGGIDGGVMKMSCIVDLPMRGPGMTKNTVALRNFSRKDGGKSSNVLYAVSGHKAAAAAVPAPGSAEFKVKPRNFCDPSGQKVQKKKLCARSMLLLPLRNLMVLGCEDGALKLCV